MEGSPIDSKGSPPTKKSQMSKHARVRRKVRPRDYPKRPLSAYNIFFKSERPSVLAEHEKAKPGNEKVDLHEVVKEVGRRWKDLDEEERSKYEDEADQDTERYRDELRAYQKEKTRLRLKEKKRLAALKAAEAKKADEETSSHSTEEASIIDGRESTEAETADSGQPSASSGAVFAPSEKRVPHHSGENRPQTSATGSAQTPITEAMLLNGKNEILARHQLEQQERMQHEQWARQQGRMLAAQQEHGKEAARSRLIQDLRVLEAARERTIQQLLELDAGEPPAYRLVDPRWEDPAGASNIPFALRASLAAGAPGGGGGFGRGRFPPPHPNGLPPPAGGGAPGYLGHYVALPPGVRGVVPDMGGYERDEAMLYPPSRELERSAGTTRPGPAGARVLPQR